MADNNRVLDRTELQVCHQEAGRNHGARAGTAQNPGQRDPAGAYLHGNRASYDGHDGGGGKKCSLRPDSSRADGDRCRHRQRGRVLVLVFRVLHHRLDADGRWRVHYRVRSADPRCHIGCSISSVQTAVANTS
eukprot:SAG11_NODE_1947_length_4015_cov_20.610827_3_plen_133_part_00